MLIKALVQPLVIVASYGKNSVLKSLTPKTICPGFRFVGQSCILSSKTLPKWGSKTKKDKRKVPLHRTIEMSLGPEQETILAPLRAKVKEQVIVTWCFEFVSSFRDIKSYSFRCRGKPSSLTFKPYLFIVKCAKFSCALPCNKLCLLIVTDRTVKMCSLSLNLPIMIC